MRKISGLALVAIGLFHILIALFLPGAIGFSSIWQGIVAVGIVDAVLFIVVCGMGVADSFLPLHCARY